MSYEHLRSIPMKSPRPFHAERLEHLRSIPLKRENAEMRRAEGKGRGSGASWEACTCAFVGGVQQPPFHPDGVACNSLLFLPLSLSLSLSPMRPILSLPLSPPFSEARDDEFLFHLGASSSAQTTHVRIVQQEGMTVPAAAWGSMSPGDLTTALAAAGADVSSCLEKSELVELAVSLADRGLMTASADAWASLSVPGLKAALAAAGVDASACLEKSDLVALAVSHADHEPRVNVFAEQEDGVHIRRSKHFNLRLDKNATSEYVEDAGGKTVAWKTMGEDDRAYFFKTQPDGTTLRVDKEEFMRIRRVGGHKIDVGTAERLLASLPGRPQSGQTLDKIRDLLKADGNLRSKTSEGNLKRDGAAERDFRRYVDKGDTDFEWTPAHDAKLRQYKNALDCKKLASNWEEVDRVCPAFRRKLEAQVKKLQAIQERWCNQQQRAAAEKSSQQQRTRMEQAASVGANSHHWRPSNHFGLRRDGCSDGRMAMPSMASASAGAHYWRPSEHGGLRMDGRPDGRMKRNK